MDSSIHLGSWMALILLSLTALCHPVHLSSLMSSFQILTCLHFWSSLCLIILSCSEQLGPARPLLSSGLRWDAGDVGVLCATFTNVLRRSRWMDRCLFSSVYHNILINWRQRIVQSRQAVQLAITAANTAQDDGCCWFGKLRPLCNELCSWWSAIPD